MKEKKKAQVLLVIIMVLATIMTIVLSVSFQSISETQISKLEEENQKTLAAAEAALERALAENQQVVLGEGSLGDFSEFSGQATIKESQGTNFTTPLVNKDKEYTFYLGSYNRETGSIGTAINQSITICFQGLGGSIPAVEVTLVKANGLKRYVYDPSGRINNASSPSTGCSQSGFQHSFVIPAADIGTDGKFLLFRVFYSSTRLYFSSVVNFPTQGRIVTSEATSQTGVSKKVVLFQSHPQIPASFFATSF